MFSLSFENQLVDSATALSAKRAVSRGYEYDVLCFAKKVTDEEMTPYSIVTNTERTRVFAYMAPRQTQNLEDFQLNYNDGDRVMISEAYEGTMITFFWNAEIGEWDISTRNGVGGNYSYLQPIKPLEDMVNLGYAQNTFGESPKTFRQMVLDAFRIRLFNSEQKLPEEINDLKDVHTLTLLPIEYCYTCILQHPENHFVYEIGRFSQHLNLVSIYKLECPNVNAEGVGRYYDVGYLLYKKSDSGDG